MAQAEASRQVPRRRAVRGGPRAVRGLVGVFLLSLLNLLGALLALAAIGGVAPWTRWQFVGLFGLLEASTALALLVAPNAWQLPVRAAAQPGERLLVSARELLLPRWGALAKLAAGGALLAAAATRTGIELTAATLLLPLLAAALAAVAVGLSLMVARLGVARPEVDVYQLIVRRPGGREIEFPGFSVGALIVQFLLNVTAIPAVKLLPPEVLYRPALAPSPVFAALAALTAALTATLAFYCWRGQVSWRPQAAELTDAVALASRTD